MTALRVKVAWASPDAQGVVEVELPEGSTVADAVAATGALERARVDPGVAGYAVFGQTADAGTRLRDGDRVEITRPLVVDPKTARRARVVTRVRSGGRRRRNGGGR